MNVLFEKLDSNQRTFEKYLAAAVQELQRIKKALLQLKTFVPPVEPPNNYVIEEIGNVHEFNIEDADFTLL